MRQLLCFMKIRHLILGVCALVFAGCSQQQQQQQQGGGAMILNEQGELVAAPGGAVVPEPAAPGNLKGTAPEGKLTGTKVKPSAPRKVKPIAPRPFVPMAPGKRVSRVNVPGNYVALTFDDGPHATLTPKALQILNRHGAKGTFFVLGKNVRRNPSIVAAAAAGGHEIGCHTWSHIQMTAKSQATVKNEVQKTVDAIRSATGVAPKVMRPPYGSINSSLVGLMYHNYGMYSILWDVDTNDWRRPGVQTVINRAVNNARPGSIILVHDIHPSTIDALEGIVTGLQARGFKLVTVSELIAMGAQAAGASAPARLPVVEDPAPAPAPVVVPAVTAAPAEETAPAAVVPETAPAPAVEPAEVTEETASL